MKGKRFLIITAGVLLFLLLACIFTKNVLLCPCLYKNNSSLSKEANKEVKALLLDAMKDQHSALFSPDESKLYTEDFILEYLYEATPLQQKKFWVDIDGGFMETVEKQDDNTYTAKIQMRAPEDWCYYFTVEVIDGQYIISDFAIDP